MGTLLFDVGIQILKKLQNVSYYFKKNNIKKIIRRTIIYTLKYI